MTGRGKPANIRPISPTGSSLAVRPVPWTRNFAARSFGPGAAADITTTARPLREVQEQADTATYYDPTPYNPILDQGIDLLREIEGWEQRGLRCYTLSAYGDEAFHRFKLDVIEDQDALNGASDDRIREEFRALIRSFNLCDDEERFVPPARNVACLVLDEATISMLVNLSFPEDPMDDHKAFSEVTIKVVDIWWQRSSAHPESSYRGVGDCPIVSLDRLYLMLMSGVNSGAMEDLHPMSVGL
ncbi:uncharacterized protein ASPGLDRAFT_24548 [Aspergillus glaucus CBS 516.65]|uniref:Uncharacterized protein n=1 Tax=Aspergillus glaucus CBS 516.65 TaxID=1160497 RepID=A0A1L9VNM7_ASPGL|nr:hypothetical protein ASPGLDRAFT_24548 [Aspergillus glaucus CBS 516.65]OJJ85527.1 hypothetical protein ASPGLDRAFT_24548 [Aspergillus glaucus CBS 516.65]